MNSNISKCLIELNNKLVTIAVKSIRNEKIKIGLPEFKITNKCHVYDEKIIFNIKQLLKIINDPKNVYSFKYDEKHPNPPTPRAIKYPIYDDDDYLYKSK
jgi:hypothetical protein